MKTILFSLLVSAIMPLAHASEEVLTIACYGDGTNAYFQVYPESKSMVLSYSKGQFEESYLAMPEGSWSERVSYIKIERSENRVKFIAQIITGDVVTPIFHTNAEITVTRDASGTWQLVQAEANHLDQPYDFTGVVGYSCYVQ